MIVAKLLDRLIGRDAFAKVSVMQEAKCPHCKKITQYESTLTDTATAAGGTEVILIGQELLGPEGDSDENNS